MNHSRRWIAELALLFCAFFVIWVAPNEANAHAALVKADPSKRATLASSPAKIRLWFNEKLEPAYSTVKVLESNGSQISTEAARVDSENPKLLILAIPILKPGTYRVKYRVLSMDGHAVESSFVFTIRSAQ